MLYSDLIGHWKKRNRTALEEVNPANIDRAMFRELLLRYGGQELTARYEGDEAPLESFYTPPPPPSQELDDFARCGISRASDIGALFTRNFYFGCEADDPLNSWAYATQVNPFKARLKTLMGSDIGHFDVVNMTDVLKEAYEPVEEGLITRDDLRDFLFTNPAQFFGEANPDFFKGTSVEAAVSRLLTADTGTEEEIGLTEARCREGRNRKPWVRPLSGPLKFS